jgi:hypothetical protein
MPLDQAFLDGGEGNFGEEDTRQHG